MLLIIEKISDLIIILNISFIIEKKTSKVILLISKYYYIFDAVLCILWKLFNYTKHRFFENLSMAFLLSVIRPIDKQ